MATFTITATKNIDALTSKTGGDIFNVNGGNLTIDQHSRFGLNNANTSATAATSMGSMTISATLGGSINIDGRYVRLIPFTGGSGTIPALNSPVTQGGASGLLMCVYSALASAPLVNGGAMPATGWIQVKQWNSVEYSAGALTLSGVTASASGASVVGFLEIMGDEASTITANRLGVFNIKGAPYKVGMTSGSANQQIQLPSNGTLKHFAGVFIEKNAGQKDYEFYPNMGTVTTVGTEATRGKVCWITNTGLLYLGANTSGVTNGYTPSAGLEIVIGNIFLCNTLTTARNAVVIPNATVATRYDFTTSGGGVLDIEWCNMEWYPSFSQAYSVQMRNVGVIDAVSISEIAAPMTWSKVGVGNKPTTALLVSALTMSLCFAGGTFTDCVWSRVSMAASGAHTNTITDIAGFDFIRDTIRANTVRANATTYALNGTRMVNCNYIDPVLIQGAMTLSTCSFMNITNTVYCENVTGTTPTTYAGYVWACATSNDITISGLTFPVANNHPYTALLNVYASSNNIKLRNIGTRAVPLTMGSANACGLIWTAAAGSAVRDIKVQRVYVSNTRTGQFTADNSCNRILMESVFGDYADAADVSPILNFTQKGLGTTKALTAQTGVYGTHFMDYFTSTTAGRLAISMNETTTLTSSQVTLENGANFTAAGGLYMPTIGMSTTFEIPYYILGHTQFANSALIMAGGTATNYNYNFSIDKNDGNGYSAMTTNNYTATTLGTALNALGALDASKGFKLKLKITTSVTNATAITSVYMTTVSSTTAQDYQYPLDTITLTLTGLVSGSDIVILNAGTEVERVNVDSNNATTYNYVYETLGSVDIKVYKRGYIPFSIMNYALGSSNASLPIAQVADRNYIN